MEVGSCFRCLRFRWAPNMERKIKASKTQIACPTTVITVMKTNKKRMMYKYMEASRTRGVTRKQ